MPVRRETILKPLWRRLRAFKRERSGNVAMMIALSAVPLVLAIGGAVDFRNASNSERDVQSDLDSAVLAASHSISTASEGELEAEVPVVGVPGAGF